MQKIIALALLLLCAPALRAAEIAVPVADAQLWQGGGARVNAPQTRAQTSDERSPDGGQAVALHYAFEASGDAPAYAQFTLKQPFTLGDSPFSLSANVRGDGQKHPLLLRLQDESGRTHQWWTKVETNWQGWRKINFAFEAPGQFYSAWGGKNYVPGSKPGFDGPVKVVGFVLEKAGGDDTSSGEILLADVRFELRAAVKLGEVVLPLDKADWQIGGQNFDAAGTAAALDAQRSPDGGSVARLDYAFNGAGDAATFATYFLKSPLEFENVPRSIALNVRGDGQKRPLALRFVESNGRSHHFYVKTVDWQGWRRVEFPLSSSAPGHGAWGGTVGKDAPLQAPLKFMGFVLDKVGPDDKGRGQLAVADVSFAVETAAGDVAGIKPVIDLVPANPLYLWKPGAPIRFNAQLHNGGPVFRADFESDNALQISGTNGQIAVGSEQFVSGKNAARVDFDFAGPGIASVALAPARAVAIPVDTNAPLQFSMQVRGQNGAPFADAVMSLRDASGENYVYRIAPVIDALRGDSWKLTTSVLDASALIRASGGDGNKRLDGPLTFTGLSFIANKAGSGAVWLDDLVLGSPTPSAATDLSAKLIWNAIDYHGREVGAGNQNVKIGADQIGDVAVGWQPHERGIFFVNARLEDETGGVLARAQSRAAALDMREKPFVGAPFLYGISFSGAASPSDIDLLAATGFPSCRVSIFWHLIQQNGPDHWDWAATDAMVKDLTARDIQIEALLGAPPRWAFADAASPSWVSAPPKLDAYATFVRAVATRYPQIKTYEIHNEPDLTDFWKGTVDQYLALWQTGYQTIKSVNPDATVMNGGFAWMNNSHNAAASQGFARAFLERANPRPDVIAYHIHSDFAGTVNNNATWLQAVRDTKTGDIPRWLNEAGFSNWGGRSDAMQAEIIWKKMVYSNAMGDASYQLFELRNRGTNPAEVEENYGITRQDGSPKAALVAANVVMEHLAGRKFVGDLKAGAGFYAYLWGDAREKTLALWHEKQFYSGLPRLLQTAATSAEVVDIMGNATPLKITDGVAVVPVSSEPRFVVLRGESGTPSLVGGDVIALAASVNVGPGAGRDVTVTVNNPFGAPLNGTLKAMASSGWTLTPPMTQISVGARGQSEIKLRAQAPASGNGTLDLELNAPNFGAPLRVSAPLTVSTVVPRVPDATRTGDVAAWTAPTFALDQSNATGLYAQTPDRALQIKGADDLSADVYFGHTTDKLLLNVRVRDDVHAQTEAIGDAWKGDSVQFALGRAGEPQWEWIMALGKEGARAAVSLAPPGESKEFKGEVSIRREGDLTIYGISVPLDSPQLRELVKEGAGFDVLVNDNDGGVRKGWLEWGSGIGIKKDAALFKPVVFAD